MANGAVQLALLAMIKRKFVLAQAGGQPGVGRVAGFALGAKQAGVDGRFFVAGHAFAGCAFEDLIDMAARAFQSEVLPFERPDQVVVEVGHVAGAIVATLAVEAELVGVVGHEDRIALQVADGALGLVEADGLLVGVAGTAGERPLVIIIHVFAQAKSGV